MNVQDVNQLIIFVMEFLEQPNTEIIGAEKIYIDLPDDSEAFSDDVPF